MSKEKYLAYYKFFSYFSLITLFLLIVAGGTVRITESGMGCPDWPKCFGKLAPPFSAKELPQNYKDKFLKIRKDKTLRFAKTLELIGFKKLSKKVEDRISHFKAENFSVYTAWIEYINRLMSVVFGISIVLQLIFSIFLFRFKELKTLFYVNIALLTFTIIQGLIGSFVVYTDLLPGIVSLHLIFTLVIIILALHSLTSNKPAHFKIHRWLYVTYFLALILSIVQIFTGTAIREEVDTLANSSVSNKLWFEAVKDTFMTHKNLAWSVFVVNGILVFGFFKTKANLLQKIALLIIINIILQFITGTLMVEFDFPAIFRLVHVIFAFLLFGCQYYVLAVKKK